MTDAPEHPGRTTRRPARREGLAAADPDRPGAHVGEIVGVDPPPRVVGVSMWRQIETCLREAITARRIMPGQRLPTETEFAAFFGVHRHTVRRAIAPLVADGLVSVRQGQGMTVRDQVIDYQVTARTRFSEIVASQALEPGGDILDLAEDAADPEVAAALGIEAGARVFRVELLRWAAGVPVTLATDYVACERLPGFSDAMRETGSMTAALTRLGAGDYRRARTVVFARMPTAEEADSLRQPPNQPLLCADSLNVAGEDDRPVHYTRARFSAQRVKLIVVTDG